MDTILLVAGYTFFSNQSIVLDKQLNITSYNNSEHGREGRATLLFGFVSDYSDCFMVRDNAIMRKLDIAMFSPNLTYIILFNLQNGKFLKVENCSFFSRSLLGGIQATNCRGYFETVTFNNITFKGISIPQIREKRKRNPLETKKNNNQFPYLKTTFNNCQFANILFLFSYETMLKSKLTISK